MTRLLFFAGSAREGAYSKKLARLAQHIASANGVETVCVDLRDYPMPIYDGDLEDREGQPEKTREFTALLGEYQGIFIVTPEYNSSLPRANEAFDADGHLKDKKQQEMLKGVVEALAVAARKFAAA